MARAFPRAWSCRERPDAWRPYPDRLGDVDLDAILSFGEILLRLAAPPGEVLLQSPRLEAGVGGAEANVAVCLARLGIPSAVVSALPDDVRGRAALEQVRRHGVDVSRVRFGPGRMGLYFLTPGRGARASEVVYDRAGSAFAELCGQTDWEAALDGAAWLHLSGASAGVGPHTAKAAIAAARAARERGLTVSFDGNYRSRLWAAWGGDASATAAAILEQATYAFIDHRDLGLILGAQIATDEPAARFAQAAELALATWPGLKGVAATVRTVHSTDAHDLAACVALRGQPVHVTPATALNGIVDRVGGGDAYAAGVIFGLIQGWSAEEVARFGLASACLKHSIWGDFNLVDREMVAALAKSGAATDVRR